MRRQALIGLLVLAVCAVPAAQAIAQAPAPQASSKLVTGRIAAPGGELYYEMQGAGPTVVLLHGGLLDTRMWDEQFDLLARDHRVIRYDARGHGRSSPIDGAFSNYRDLDALLTGLGIGKAVLVGLSLGGRTAMDFALVYPDKVAAVVAVSPGISGFDFTKDPVLREHDAAMDKAAAAGNLDGFCEAFLRAWTDGPKRTPAGVNAAVRERVHAMARPNLAKPNRGGRLDEANALPRLKDIRVPVFAVLGELDMAGIHEIVKLIETQVPGARAVTVQGAAHMLNMEKPAEFNRLLLEFLATVRR